MDKLLSERESADFAAVRLANVNDLQDLGFTLQQIVTIVEESELTVRAQLSTEKRE